MLPVKEMQIGILEPDRFCLDVEKQLSAIGQVIFFDGKDLDQFLAELDVLFVRLSYKIDNAFIAKCNKLQYLCSPTTGHTHIDESEVARKGIEIISLRGQREFLETIRATPEHTFGLILALLRKYKPALVQVDKGGWNRDQLRGEELFGQRVGIIGLGRVGFRVASYCSAFGARINYHDKQDVVADDSWLSLQDIKSVISQSQIVVLCASYSNGDEPIIGAGEVEMLKGKYFINTARGELVDEICLLQAVKESRLRGIATDVITDETANNNLSQWRDCAIANENVIVTPHIGGATFNSMARTEGFIAKRLEHLIRKEK